MSITSHQAVPAFPNIDSPLTKDSGKQSAGYLERPWFQLFYTLWQSLNLVALNVFEAAADTPLAPGLPYALALGASPAQLYAPDNGHVLVSGGTVTSIFLSRDGGNNFFNMGMTSGPVPVVYGDLLKITYTVLPIATMVNG